MYNITSEITQLAYICVKSTMNLNQGEKLHFQLDENNYQGVSELLEEMRRPNNKQKQLAPQKLIRGEDKRLREDQISTGSETQKIVKKEQGYSTVCGDKANGIHYGSPTCEG